MKKYVLGFAFSQNKENIVLIKKEKPEWQKGLINGIGGKVEETDRTIQQAMIREFKEETGVDTKLQDWDFFATMTFKNDIMGGSAEVYCFRMFNDSIFDCKTIETEEIIIFDLIGNMDAPYPFLGSRFCIKNLKILIPMALDTDFVFSDLNIK